MVVANDMKLNLVQEMLLTERESVFSLHGDVARGFRAPTKLSRTKWQLSTRPTFENQYLQENVSR